MEILQLHEDELLVVQYIVPYAHMCNAFISYFAALSQVSEVAPQGYYYYPHNSPTQRSFAQE